MATVLAASVGLAACTPGPAPQPTPTPLFTSEADAFKAAEQVYRDYVDAGNKSRNGDSSIDPTEYLSGAALESSVNSSREVAAQGLTLGGTIVLRSFSGTTVDLSTSEVDAKACVDVSGTHVMDKSGQDVTPRDRPIDVALELQFSPAGGGGLLITRSTSGETPCG